MRAAAPLVLALALVPACGHADRAVPPVGNVSAGAPPPPAEEWAAFVEGREFALDDRAPDGTRPARNRISATVTAVELAGGRRTIRLRWSDAVSSDLPSTIEVTPTEVRFVEQGRTFPRATDRSGVADTDFTVKDTDGAICYVHEDWPPEGQECSDVCEGQICIDPTHGILRGMGVGWPNSNIYNRVDLPVRRP